MKTKGMQALAPAMVWLVPAAVAGVAMVAVISYIRSEETHAASGSPLYGQAVREAIDGLKNPGAKPVAARPPLPAGLSAAEVYWCEQCKAYHKGQPGQAQPAAATPAPVAGAAATPIAQPDSPIPPLPAGLAAADYYWCANCKTYHKRQAAEGQPADAAPPPLAGHSAPPAAVTQPAATIPPLPAGFAADDYYWCPSCKAYHQRQPAAPVPASGTAPVVPAPVAPVVPAPVAPAPVAPTPVVPAPVVPTPVAPAPVAPVPAAPAAEAAPLVPATPAAPVAPVAQPPAAPVTPAPPGTPVTPVAQPPAAPVTPAPPGTPPVAQPPGTPVTPAPAPPAAPVQNS
ncbi:MAG: hypothetical protein NTW21_38045 [Verrucomicrobia bacterium]|nr:hypothetical protein [Verrucomicrobiota bacterium]